MRKYLFCVWFVWSLILLIACEEEDQQSDFLILSTHEVKIDGTTENGVEFSASILLESGETIMEQGFTYGLLAEPDFQDFVLKVPYVSSLQFEIVLEDALRPDTTYYVRSFVRTEKFLIYGNEVSFYSNGTEPPLIETIEPAMAFWGDTIQITGKNFDLSGKHNTVWFSEFESTQTWGSMDTLFAIVPEELNTKKSEISVRLYGQQSDNRKVFEMFSPIVDSISQVQGQYPDEVIVFGDFFSTSSNNPVAINLIANHTSYEAGTVINRNQISLKIPFVGLETEESLSLEIVQQGVSLLLNDVFMTKRQSVFLESDSVTLRQPVHLMMVNCDMRNAPIKVRINNNLVDDYFLKVNRTELIFDLDFGTFEDERFSIDLYLAEKVIYSTVVHQAGPKIKEIYNQQVNKNGVLEFYVLGVDFSKECQLQWKNSAGEIFETTLSSIYNRVLIAPEFHAKTTLSDEIIAGEYSVRLRFYNRYSEWRRVTVL